MPEAERTASGPKRAPERNDVPPSQGIPKTAACAPSSDATCGSRANVRGPVKRGAASASHGSCITEAVPATGPGTPERPSEPGQRAIQLACRRLALLEPPQAEGLVGR